MLLILGFGSDRDRAPVDGFYNIRTERIGCPAHPDDFDEVFRFFHFPAHFLNGASERNFLDRIIGFLILKARLSIPASWARKAFISC